MHRDGVDAAQAEALLAAQASREQRLSVAHDIIHNTGDIAALAPQVETLHRRYLGLAHDGLAQG
jgi:dephospho-CoA kinase